MESISTFNAGAALAEQSKSFPLKELANQARKLVGAENRLEGNKSNEKKELMEVAKKFEAILVHQMLKAMRKTVHKSDLLNSFSLQQYESMMDEEIANEMVKHKGIGLADSLFYQLSRLEEASNQKATTSNKLLGVNHNE